MHDSIFCCRYNFSEINKQSINFLEYSKHAATIIILKPNDLQYITNKQAQSINFIRHGTDLSLKHLFQKLEEYK